MSIAATRRSGWAARIALAVGALLLVATVGACDSGPGQGGEIDGTQWILRSYVADGTLVDVPEGAFADLAFDHGRASGFDGCNDFTGDYTAKGSKLEFGQLATTLMACPPPESDVASGYGSARRHGCLHGADTSLVCSTGTAPASRSSYPPSQSARGRRLAHRLFSDGAGSVVAPVEGSEPSVTFVGRPGVGDDRAATRSPGRT
jgi:hypothetical protein